MRKPQPKHWYKITYEECPVCGCGDTYRERQFTPRPEDKSERIRFKSDYDGCLNDGYGY